LRYLQFDEFLEPLLEMLTVDCIVAYPVMEGAIVVLGSFRLSESGLGRLRQDWSRTEDLIDESIE